MTNQEAAALLKVTVKSQDAKRSIGPFRGAIIEMALASYPGFFCTTPPTDATPFGVYWPTLVPADVPKHAVVLEDGTRIPIPPTAPGHDHVRVDVPPAELPRRSSRSDALSRLGHAVWQRARATREAMRTSASGRETI